MREGGLGMEEKLLKGPRPIAPSRGREGMNQN